MKNNSLEKINNHPGYYRSKKSGVIYFRKRVKGENISLSCKTDKITHAKKYIETEVLPNLLSQSENEKRKSRGIVNPLLSELWHEMLIEKDNVEEYTAKRRESAWRIDLKEYWGQKFAKDINSGELRKFEKWFQKHKPGKNFFTARKYLQMFINWLHTSGYISRNIKVTDLDPTIKRKHGVKPVGYVFTKKELESLRNCGVVEVELAYWFSARMGLRKMEFLSLSIDSIDLKKRNAGFIGKGHKFRNVPIPRDFIPILKKRIQKSKNLGTEYIFPAEKNKDTHMASQVWDKKWYQVKKELSLPGVARPHDLRHTFATNTARNNWSPILACEILGHNLKHYQETYVHLTAKDILRMVDNLEEF